MLGTLQRELGSLDKIKTWISVLGMVNSAPGFTGQTPVINGFSETIIEVFGEEKGKAARSAVGMAGLPFGIPVEVQAELELC
jgi:enamine deaminase RidA (YjgF/YER057c/UK114 family)